MDFYQSLSPPELFLAVFRPSGLFVFVSVFVGYGHGGPVGQVVGVDVGGGEGAVALAVEEGVALVGGQAQQAAGELGLGDVIKCLHICSFFVCETSLYVLQSGDAGFEGCEVRTLDNLHTVS